MAQATATCADWAEANVILPATEGTSGRLHLRSYQRGILACVDDRAVDQITLQMSSQIGKTLLTNIILAYVMLLHGGHLMYAAPSESDVKLLIQNKLYALADHCQPFADLLEDARKRAFDIRSGIKYANGYLSIGTGGAPRSLRNKSAQFVVADELDMFDGSLDANNPVSMLTQRQLTFKDGSFRMVLLSTPTNKESSFIHQEYEAGDGRQFWVPCQGCDTAQLLEWPHNILPEAVEIVTNADLAWPDDRDLAMIVCRHCGYLHPEQERRAMIDAGEWRAQRPFQGHASFQINQFYNLEATLQRTLNDAKKMFRRNDRRSFTTQVLAEPYELPGGTVKPEKALEGVVDERPWPESDRQFTTCGVDVQKDRIEYALVDWSYGGDWHVAEYDIIARRGDSSTVYGLIPALKALRRRLLELTGSTKRRQKSAADCIFVDCANETEEVVFAVRDVVFDPRKRRANVFHDIVWPAYGIGRSGGTFNADRLVGKNKERRKMATDLAKLYIRDDIRDGKFTIQRDRVLGDKGTPDVRRFAEQLTSEVLVEEVGRVQGAKAVKKFRWRKPVGKRNEALDCIVMAMCARELLIEPL